VEDFFLGEIENDNTRLAYGRAVRAFLTWCDLTDIPDLETIRPPHVRLYLKTFKGEAATTKQHRAAIRVFFDVLVSTGELPVNPAASVKGPKLSMSRGKTPVLSAEDTRKLLETIPTLNILDLRDRPPLFVWQGLRVLAPGEWALMGTTVVPEFLYSDFELGKRDELLTLFPQHQDTILRYTRE